MISPVHNSSGVNSEIFGSLSLIRAPKSVSILCLCKKLESNVCTMVVANMDANRAAYIYCTCLSLHIRPTPNTIFGENLHDVKEFFHIAFPGLPWMYWRTNINVLNHTLRYQPAIMPVRNSYCICLLRPAHDKP